MIRIVIADDHELIREGIKKIIRASSDMCVVGEAASVEQALVLARKHAPDIVILDIGLPGHEGLGGLVQMRDYVPSIPILLLSMYPEERFAIGALKLGAAGYVSKSMAAEELLKGIRKVISGGTYISARLAELMAANIQTPVAAPHEYLTSREFEILCMLGAGKQAKQIAAELSISISSVNTYRARTLKKLGLPTTANLIRYAIEHNLVK